MNSTVKTVLFWLLIGVSALLLWEVVKNARDGQKDQRVQEVSVTQFMSDIDQNNIREIEVYGMEVRGKYRDGIQFHTTAPVTYFTPEILKNLHDKGVVIKFRDINSANIPLTQFGTWVPLILLGALWFFWIMTWRPGQAPSGSNETSVFKGTLLLILALAAIIWGFSHIGPTAGTQDTFAWGRDAHAVCSHSTTRPVLATDRYDDPDAYSVYSVIVPTFPPNEKFGGYMIRRETVPLPSSEVNNSEAPAAMKNYVELKNYVEMNQKAWLLENRFNLPKSYRLLSADWSPGQWVELSAVGFNADKTEAVVYMEYWCAPDCCCGQGFMFQLKKNFFGK